MNYNLELYHHGIKGQKWGVRRWQNSDGTFNDAGKKRYFGDGAGENYHKLSKKITSSMSNENTSSKQNKTGLSDKQKKALKIGLAVAGTAIAAYGAYKLADYALDKNYEKQMKAAHDYLQKNIFDKNVAKESALFSEGNFKAYDESRRRSMEISKMAYSSLSDRKTKFDPKKLEQQIKRMDRQKANQDYVRKMVEEGIKNGGVQGTFNFPELGINNMGFDYRK